jgi:antitoxin component YwqK of YwqJK toxin-antitoxin module
MRNLSLLLVFWGGFSCSTPVEQGGFSDVPEGAVLTDFTDDPDLKMANIYAGNEIAAQGEYFKGIRSGTWTEYYTNTGGVKSITTYINGQKEGIFIQLNDQGALEEKLSYHKDLPHGKYRKYKRGRIIEEREYAYGQLDGTMKKYYEKGPIMEESLFSAGVRNGMARWYDQEGNLTIEYEYANGELIKEDQ